MTTSSSWTDYMPFRETSSSAVQNQNDDPENPPPPPAAASNTSRTTTTDKNHRNTTNDNTLKTPLPPPPSSSSQPMPFRRQVQLFFAMATPYFRESTEGRCLFGGLICLMVLDSTVRVIFSYLARDFWTALGDRDSELFYNIIRNFMIALLFLAPINVFYRFQRLRLAIRWRQWMTNRIMELYFYNNHHIYYRLEQQQQFQQQENGEKGINTTTTNFLDNPDQRIAEDVRSFTEYSLSFFLTVAVSIIDLSAFSTILYLIEPTLFLSIVGFATVGTIVTMLVGHGLVRLNFERLQREANFRLSLVRIRTNAESIAFFGGEESEGQDVSKRFTDVIRNAFDIIGTQRNLEFFTTTYSYMTWILPVVVIAPQYMAGDVELGVVQQAAAVFGHVLEDLSLVINEFESLTAFTASIGRLNQFLRAIQLADPDRNEESPLLGINRSQSNMMNDGLFKTTTLSPKTSAHPEDTKVIPLAPTNIATQSCIDIHEYPSSTTVDDRNALVVPQYALSIKALRLDTPDRHQTLIPSLDLDLKWGQRLLIQGQSGIGKSSLLRAIAGLWTSGSGTIERVNKDDVYFVPQRPYCPIGTLRQQLLYPEKVGRGERDDRHPEKGQGSSVEISNSRLLEILQAVNLGDLPSRVGDGNDLAGLDATADWSNMLSLGEQQRLAFGRILVHRPRLIIADESTSACDVRTEQIMYNLLRNLRSEDKVDGSGGFPTTYVSVGHRPTLLGYHDKRLHIFKDDNGNTTYTLSDIHSTSSSSDGLASEEVAMFFQ
jgi:vitamin B12/bleomycin/antimicrobial peptide transport system ATP-binding/permease protein